MRTTKKLNKKIKKNRKHNNKMSRKMSRKIIGAGPSEKDEHSETDTKKSKKGIMVKVRSLGNSEPASDSYGKRKFTKEQISTFVSHLEDGIQIVSLPTPPQSHSIVVNIVDTATGKKVMIADWGGEKNRYLGKDTFAKTGKRKTIGKPQWQIYSMLIDALEEQRGSVEYYPVDDEIYAEAAEKHETCSGQGGCSHYMFEWIDKHLIKKEDGYTAMYEKIDTPY